MRTKRKRKENKVLHSFHSFPLPLLPHPPRQPPLLLLFLSSSRMNPSRPSLHPKGIAGVVSLLLMVCVVSMARETPSSIRSPRVLIGAGLKPPSLLTSLASPVTILVLVTHSHSHSPRLPSLSLLTRCSPSPHSRPHQSCDRNGPGSGRRRIRSHLSHR